MTTSLFFIKRIMAYYSSLLSERLFSGDLVAFGGLGYSFYNHFILFFLCFQYHYCHVNISMHPVFTAHTVVYIKLRIVLYF